MTAGAVLSTLEPYRGLLEAALEHTGGTHTFADVCLGWETGAFQAWIGERSILVTEIILTPQTRELHVFLAAGDMSEIEHLEDIVMTWARSKGCTRATAIARPGWARTWVTKRAGWTPTHTVFTKELRHGQEP